LPPGNTAATSAATPKPAAKAAHSFFVSTIADAATAQPAKQAQPPSRMLAAAKATNSLPGAWFQQARGEPGLLRRTPGDEAVAAERLGHGTDGADGEIDGRVRHGRPGAR
jgi:hypothetical protein